MGREERQNGIDSLNEQIKACNEDLRYLNSMRRIQTSEDFKNSVDVLLNGFESKVFRELLEETTLSSDGKTRRPVEAGELLIRQRVYNRINALLGQFKGVEKKIEDAEQALKKAEDDLISLTEE